MLSIAGKRFRDVWVPLVGAFLMWEFIILVIQQAPNIVLFAFPGSALSTSRIFRFGAMGLSWVVAPFFDVGYTRMLLVAARGGTPQFATIFSGADRFLPVLACNFLRIVGVLLGFVALVVPAFILGCGWAFAIFYVVDADMGPVQALRASWDATRGLKVQVFVLGLLYFLLLIAGMAMCCVGWLATCPIAVLSFAVAFIRTSGRMIPEAGAEPEIASPGL